MLASWSVLQCRFMLGKARLGVIGAALVLVTTACGEINAGPPAPGGSGQGGNAGSSSGLAGASGGGGGPSAGTGGAEGVSVPDAGQADAAGSQGGSFSLPPGCPTPAPEPAVGQTIAIQSINVQTSEIVLRNVATTPQTLELGRQAWQWCEWPMYSALEVDVSTVTLAPGDTYAFIAINNQSGRVTLYSDEGEMAMYPTTGVFEEYEFIQAFVAWGEIQAVRESYAVQKGLWVFGERIQINPGDAGFIATGPTDVAAGYTSVAAECLRAPPNP